jgi:hypothetical protein
LLVANLLIREHVAALAESDGLSAERRNTSSSHPLANPDFDFICAHAAQL